MDQTQPTAEPVTKATILVAWSLDEPMIEGDGRFWTQVLEQTQRIYQRPVGTIVPSGQSLTFWRTQADGNVLGLSRPHAKGAVHARVSLARWGEADPDRTQVSLAFLEPSGPVPRPMPPTVTPVTITYSEDAQRLKREQAELQRQFRAARDDADDEAQATIRKALQSTGDDLARAAFPHHPTRDWDLTKAIRQDPDVHILDWTAGY